MRTLSTLAFELCQLPGAASVGMIRANRTLQMFGGRAKGAASFIELALGLQGAP
jgi:hypothetical protein